MNKKWIKKGVLNVMVVTCAVGMLAGMSAPIKAADNTVNVQAADKSQGTTVSIESLATYKKNTTLTCVFERAGGISKDVSYVTIKGDIEVEINGQKNILELVAADYKCERVSDTKVKVKITGCLKKSDTKASVDLSQLKGQKATITIPKVRFVNKYTEVEDALMNQIKKAANEKSVPFEQGNIKINYDERIEEAKKKNELGRVETLELLKEDELKHRPANVLPEKKLNVPIVKGVKECTFDNVGFVDGKLHIRVKAEKNISFDLILSKTGKAAFGNGIQEYYNYDSTNESVYLVFKLSETSAMTKQQFKLDMSKTFFEDTNIKSTAYKLK